MYNRTYDFLDKHNIFFTSQYGFRKKHSCEHAVTELIGEICKGLENGKHTLSLFIDLSKAFDTISHNILFAKLDRYGIRGTALQWYQSYLNNRFMRAKCNISSTSNTIFSDKHPLDIGAPQGSVLGPLLFLIFCNDLYLNLELCKGILFADDTTVYKSHHNMQYLEWCMKHDMEILTDWFKANHPSLNSNKAVGILFSNKPDVLKTLKLCEADIKMVETTKFLGILLDHKLTWKTHLQHVINKLKRNINMLKIGQKFLSTHSKKLIYFAQIQSHFCYGLSVWGNMISKTEINKLQQIQNKCISLINSKSATHHNYKELRILRINELIKLENCKFGYKLSKQLLPPRISFLANHDQNDQSLLKTHPYQTRNKTLLNKPLAVQKAYKSCIVYKGTESLQPLKAETRSKPNLQSFARACKNYFFENY